MLLLFGPRLDRPSAVGDEGRPRATGLSIAAFVVVGLFAAATAAAGRIEFLPTVALAVSVTVAGAALLGRDRLGALLLGQLSFLPFASGLVGIVALSFVTTPYGVLVAGFVVSMLGVAGAWADVWDGEHVTSVAVQSLLAYGSMLAGVVAFALVGGVGWLLWTALRAFLGGVDPGPSAVGFAALVFGLCLSVRIALSALPLVELAPTSRRAAAAARVDRWKRRSTAGAVSCFLGSGALSMLWAFGGFERLDTATPGTAVALEALSSPFVAGPVVVGSALCLLAAAGAWLARWLTRELDPKSARRLAAVVGGGVLVVASVPLVAAALSIRGVYGYALAVSLALGGPPVVLAGIGVGFLAAKLGVLPARAAGPALAGAGLVVATAGAGSAGLPGPVVFACAAGALVVWDVSSFGLGVTAELGHIPETRRLELSHGVLGVGLGVVAVLAATGLDALRTAVGSADGVTAAAVAAVVGVLFLLASLRG